MSATESLKNASRHTIDELLAYSGLRRQPSVFSQVLSGAGLVSAGALAGAGLMYWLGPMLRRPRVVAPAPTPVRGSQAAAMVSEGGNTSTNGSDGKMTDRV